MNFVHNDIKCENLLVGLNDPETLYLIDFGLTNRYVDHEPESEKLKRFSGNILFASIS